MILEVCANSYQSAINAQRAGAHRIELCSELAVGGITPSYGLIKQVVSTLSIPVFILVRPRSGNFTYTDVEIDIMKQDIEMCKILGCTGVVSGVLNVDNTIDEERTKALVECAKPMDFTFHRAFDWVPNPKKALQQLIKIGVDRVLTSGQQASAEQGIDLLSELKTIAKDTLEILPGGGIKPNNAVLFKQKDFSEIHVSATSIKVVNQRPTVPMNSDKFFDETIISYSSIKIIEDILGIISKV